jgi:hypothetical protein
LGGTAETPAERRKRKQRRESSRLAGLSDFVMRPGEGAVPFSSKDTLIGLKDGGPIEKSFGKLDNSSSGGNSGGHITFSPIKIEGSIKIDGGGEVDLKDPIIAREISNMVQMELRKSIGGGKLNPNPVS